MHSPLILALLLSLASALGQEIPKSVMVSELPADAVEVRADVFKRMEHGKPIIYIKTPLGVTRTEQTETMRHVLEDGPPMGIRVRETAVAYFFERDTPFGTPKWTKKKGSLEKLDKLGSEEQEAIDYQRKVLKALAAKPSVGVKK